MKAFILAGGYGTRLSEITDLKPKPMVEIGGKPILWHILKIFSHYGVNEFVILLGYKGYVIKEYFYNYYLHQSDVTIDLATNNIEIHNNTSENWKVTLLDTGLDTLTGGRLKRATPYIQKGEPFLMTYGDGLANVDIHKLLEFHQKHGKLATMTAIQPEGRFGALDITTDNRIKSFVEKPKGDGAWVNGGFFVLDPKVLDYIEGDYTVFEKEPLENLAKDNQLMAYKHYGFWQCMDTMRDKNRLEQEWNSPNPGWKVWK
jgi:glucose-1-phosphate cytidylyltransferase